jgi:hypothetical protein
LLYWYKSTSTDTCGAALQAAYQVEEQARLKEKAVLLERRAEAERLRESIRVG